MSKILVVNVLLMTTLACIIAVQQEDDHDDLVIYGAKFNKVLPEMYAEMKMRILQHSNEVRSELGDEADDILKYIDINTEQCYNHADDIYHINDLYIENETLFAECAYSKRLEMVDYHLHDFDEYMKAVIENCLENECPQDNYQEIIVKAVDAYESIEDVEAYIILCNLSVRRKVLTRLHNIIDEWSQCLTRAK